MHDGSANIGTVVDLWGQYFSYSQHTAARVHIEEKVKFNFYLAIRESMLMRESLTGHVLSVDNPEDIFTKVVPVGGQFKHLIGSAH